MRDELRANAQRLVADAGLQIEFIRKFAAFRKEDRGQAILAEGSDHPGLAHTFSATETRSSYRPWHDKASNKAFFKPTTGRCLRDYFDFIDAKLCLGYVRAPV